MRGAAPLQPDGDGVDQAEVGEKQFSIERRALGGKVGVHQLLQSAGRAVGEREEAQGGENSQKYHDYISYGVEGQELKRITQHRPPIE